MAYILDQQGITVRTFTLSNAEVQTITAGSPIILQQSSGRPFALVGASIYYINATTQFKTNTAGGYAYILVDSVLMGQYQDFSLTSFTLNPGFAVSYQVNYDQSGPLFCGPFRTDEIAIDFDGSYGNGDGELIIKVAGFYL